ncbi:MAG: peptidoglycan DD-metalloendopeptidase family protein, partial [Chloroflexota bacterium]
FGLEFHAWVVLKGQNVNGEANRVRETCNTSGVRSLLLDVESGPGYFSGGADSARDLIQKIRAGIAPDFHLGLNFDARGAHPKHIYIDEWLPHVQSLHPMVYHKDFGIDVGSALDNMYAAIGNIGKPIIPMLQAYGGVNPSDIFDGANKAINELGCVGVTIYRLGTMGSREYEATRRITFPTTVTAPPPSDPDPDPTLGGRAIIIRSGDQGYTDGAYTPNPNWQTFTDAHGWNVKYKLTSASQDVYAGYTPQLPSAGRYKIEVFIPNDNSDASSVLYFVVFYRDGQRIEQKVSIDQSIYYNEWVSLGVYDLDPSQFESGRVNQVDYSDQPPATVVFSAVRWTPSEEQPVVLTNPADYGFDSPIGTNEERLTMQIWPGGWKDANGYARWYGDSAGNGAYHTGADLNLNEPRWNMDAGAAVYAIGSGVVTWAARRGDVWRNIIIVEHDPLPDGTKVCARYAHIEDMLVAVGDRVTRGQQIASVGQSGGPGANYHLHFDISTTDILKQNPGHWPGKDVNGVYQHYVDPKAFLESHRPPNRS